MKQEFLIKLKEMEKKFPFMFSAPASDKEIEQVEELLNVTLSEQYKTFLKHYGGAMVGPYPIFGPRPVESMDVSLNTVESVTAKFRKDGWDGADMGAIISENHAGDPVILKNNGSVFLGSHDGAEQLSWSNFDEFLSWCLNR